MSSEPSGAAASSASQSREGDGRTDVVLSVQGVGKRYALRRTAAASLRRLLVRARSGDEGHWALRGVSFELVRGESFAIVGRNGSGKSTLLQLICGNLALTEGRIEVGGSIGALLELGGGFNPEFTGRENARLQGILIGLSEARIAELMPAIEEFADIGQFFDEPVRTYSSGMFVRLAFAVQVQVQPDILIVDEALAVGDALFQKRCFRKMEEMQRRGVALLFVSHDLESVRSLTRRALLLDRGRPLLLGNSGEVLLEYRKLLHEAERTENEHTMATMTAAATQRHVTSRAESSGRHEFGDGTARILDVALLDRRGEAVHVFATGEPMVIRVRFVTLRDCDHLSVGVRIRNRQGVKVYAWGTLNQDMAIRAGLASGEIFWQRRFRAGAETVVELCADCRLGPDVYEVQVAVSREETPDYRNQRLLHWRDEAAFFQVTMEQDRYFFGGVFDLQMQARW